MFEDEARDGYHDRLFERRPPSERGVIKIFIDHSNILLGLYKVRSRRVMGCL